MNTARRLQGASSQSNTLALIFGGLATGPATTGATESWNGTSWTNENDLSTVRFAFGGAGTQGEALAMGPASAEEWIGNGIITETVN